MRRTVLAVVAAMVLTSCDETQTPLSTDFELSRVDVTCEVASNGEAVTVGARFTVYDAEKDFDRGTLLGPGDRLSASAEGAPERELGALDESGRVGTLLQTSSQSVDVALSRRGTSRTGTVTLPEAFVLTGPATIAAGDPVELRWGQADAELTTTVTVLGTCLERFFRRQLQQDTGTYTLQPGDLSINGVCTLQVSVSRARVRRQVSVGSQATA